MSSPDGPASETPRRRGPGFELGPIRPAALYLLGAIAAIKGASLVLMAEAVAVGVVGVIAGDDAAWRGALWLGVIGALLRSVSTWAGGWAASRIAIVAKVSLRRDLAERLVTAAPSDGQRPGSVAVIGTVALDTLDAYYRTALPALVTTAVVPLMVGIRILTADWVSALVVVLTVPLIPLFMILIGLHTQERTDAATEQLRQLSNQLVELARGLPVLVGLGRVEEQTAALDQISERYRRTTMQTLRTAFLSSLALELIATLSVAVVAVFVGVRLVYGEMDLTMGLVALILAPECYQPLRDLGTAFHAAQDGTAALRESRAATKPAADRAIVATDADTAVDGDVVVHGLTLRYPDRDSDAVADLSFTAPAGGVTWLNGPSGAGKSTVLALIAGVIEPTGGTISGAESGTVAWIPQHPRTIATTVRGEIALYAEGAPVSVVDDVLARLDLAGVAESDPAQLSPGELRRVAVARGLVRIAARATVLVADEPTAHLDAVNANRVATAIAELTGVTRILASHETSIANLAETVVTVGSSSGTRAERDAGDADQVSLALADADAIPDPALAGPPAGIRQIASFLRPAAGRLLGAALLGTAAALFAVSLTALSGWLIVRASEQPPIMFLTVAIVGVRFFGIGRAALRYAERLVTHDVVLRSVATARVRMWRGLASLALSARSVATGGAALDLLVGAGDRVRDLVPRVVMPPIVATLTAAAAIIAFAIIFPPALLALVPAIVLALVVGPAAAAALDRSASASVTAARGRVIRTFTGIAAASSDVRGNAAGGPVLAELDRRDAELARAGTRGSAALSLGQAIVALACLGAVVAVLPLSAPAVAAGTLAPTLLALLVLTPMGLIDPFAAHIDAVQQWPALREALGRVQPALDADPGDRAERTPTAPPVAVDRLDLDELVAAWPGAERGFGPVTASVRPGDWLVVTGPSGAGKSTLLTTLLGHLPPRSGSWHALDSSGAPLSTDAAARSTAWCPQEAHIFDSTIRGNLQLARPSGDAASDAELTRALEVAGLGPLLSRLPDGLDTSVGSSGSALSGGERQRLAVARTLLSRGSVVLLDEPTAHLDAELADALVADLRTELSDRIVVLVSHHDDEIVATDTLTAAPR